MANRHRERELPKTYGTYTKTEYGLLFDEEVHTLSAKSEVMDDEVVPNFRRRIARGEVINNHCSYVVESSTAGGGSYTAINALGETVYVGSGGSQTLYHKGLHPSCSLGSKPVSVNVDNLFQAAKMNAIANIDSTPYAMMEDAFEIRETLRFLRKPLGSLSKLSKSYRKAVKQRNGFKAKNVKELLKDASDVWLQYRFAATPLVRSAMDIHESLTTAKRKYPKRLVARGFSDDEEIIISEPRCFFSADQYDDFRHTSTRTNEIKAGILYQVSNPLRDVRFRYGMRAKDVPETLWAIMPYSFMVDRVVDISGSIRSLTNLLDPNVEILAGWVTEKETLESKLQHISETLPGWTLVIVGDEVVEQEFTYSRTVWSPGASDAMPTFDIKGLVSDAKYITDLCALTLQRMSF